MKNDISHTDLGNDLFEIGITFDHLLIKKDDIERSLGYPDKRIPAHFKEMIGEVLSELPKRCAIRAGYRILDAAKAPDRNDGMIIGGTFFTTERIVAGQLKKSEKAAVFICTIGPEMETWSRRLLKDGEPVLGHIVDTVASEAVESATDILHDHIGERMLGLGSRITNRYSPGYCDWSVSEQHLLFPFFPPGFCGITLTDSALMIPIKSISGVIGIGPDVERVDYFCDTCGMKDCTYRVFRLARRSRTKNE